MEIDNREIKVTSDMSIEVKDKQHYLHDLNEEEILNVATWKKLDIHVPTRVTDKKEVSHLTNGIYIM